MKQILFAILGLCFFSSCSHKIYDSLDWQSNKVTVDGKISEWSNPLRFYNDKSKVNYTVTNDRRNLYLCLKVTDITAQVKILRGGMEFRIDTSGKSNFPIALLYPVANRQMTMRNRGESPSVRNPRERSEHSSLAQNLLLQAKECQLVGFKPPLGGTLSLFDRSTGILAAMDIDSLGIMYYEAVIPFRTFYKDELVPSDSNKVFSYEIKINAVPYTPHEGGSGGGGRSAGGAHGGVGVSGNGFGGSYGGGHHGGGMGGMHGGGQRPSNQNNQENSAFTNTDKIVTKLRFSIR